MKYLLIITASLLLESVQTSYRKLPQKQNINMKIQVMFLNRLVRSRLSYRCHVWRQTPSDQWLKVALSKGSLGVLLKTTLQNSKQNICIRLQKSHQLKLVSLATRRVNNNIMKMLTCHTTLNESLRRMLPLL